MTDPRRGLPSEMLADIQSYGYAAAHLIELALLSGAFLRYIDRPISISWNGHTWTPEDWTFQQLQYSQDGMIITTTVLFGGIGHPVSLAFQAEAAGGVGHTITIYEVHVNADRTIRDTPQIVISGLTVQGVRDNNGCSVPVQMSQTAFDASVPSQIFDPAQCQHLANFKGDECQYAGSGTCDGTLTGCKALGNQANFGAYPGVLAPNQQVKIGSGVAVAMPRFPFPPNTSGRLGLEKPATR